jgi:FkbM family methyltransferase
MIRHNTGFFLHEGSYSRQDLNVWDEVVKRDCYYTHLMPTAATVADIGAHIGFFASKWKEKCPEARITCVEACPENIPILQANVPFANVIHAACTYEPGELKLANSIQHGGKATGGSVVLPASTVIPQDQLDSLIYWEDSRPLPKVTLHEVMERMGVRFLDLLKLDCEGSEYSILEHAPLERIAFICGEYHDCAKWDAFVSRFKDWDYGHMSRTTGQGIFHLRNRHPIRTVVFTNGCFDLLGPHHIRFLKEARAIGDRLIVGLNSDRSVRELKGEGRIFDSEQALESLVAEIRPEVMVKGGDWSGKPLTGQLFADTVTVIPLSTGSTTSTIERIKCA